MVNKNTTSVYLAYRITENFIEIWFQANSLKFFMMSGHYDDSRGLVTKLNDSYKKL